MRSDLYAAGKYSAMATLGFQKEALAGAAIAGARALGGKLMQSGVGQVINSGVKAVGAKVGPAAISQRLAPYGAAAEQATARGVGHVLGKPGEQVANKLLKGTAGEMARQTAGGAAIGGVFEGGLNAALAEDGQRGDAFMDGLGHGAVSGAAFGGISGAVGQPFRNLRKSSLTQTAQRQGLRGQTASKAVDAQVDRGFFGSARDAIMGPKTTGLGRSGAAQNVAGGVGQFGTEMVVPAMMLPASLGGFGGSEAEPQLSPTPPEEMKLGEESQESPLPSTVKTVGSAIPLPVLAGSATGALGGIGMGMYTDVLKKHPRFPKGKAGIFLGRALPAAGFGIGSLTGHQVGRELFPAPQEQVEEKLQQIDFDKLMRYYKKQPGAQE